MSHLRNFKARSILRVLPFLLRASAIVVLALLLFSLLVPSIVDAGIVKYVFQSPNESPPDPDPPGPSHSPPGPFHSPPGQSKDPPGQSHSPPGPFHSPPGQSLSPPGPFHSPPGPPHPPPGQSNSPRSIELVSISSDGTPGNRDSYYHDISADGRYVAFNSRASNLVAGDKDDTDVFVHDRKLGVTTLVSVASNSDDGYGSNPSISGRGRYVAFHSGANNLVPDDENGKSDIFVHDRQTGQTTRVSVRSDGVEANDHCQDASISADGRFVAFECLADNLVEGDDNDTWDIFVHDRHDGTTACASVDSAGTVGNGRSSVVEDVGPAISADGRFIVFASYATNLVAGDDNDTKDIFVHDRDTGDTTRVSAASDGTESNSFSDFAAISADGRYVAFASSATNLVPEGSNHGIFIHDRNTGQTTRIPESYDGDDPDYAFYYPSLSKDGRYVTFQSNAADLVTGDTNGEQDIFVHDRQTGMTKLVSVAYDGSESNGGSYIGVISADGKYVSFFSWASNLVPATFARSNVFVASN